MKNKLILLSLFAILLGCGSDKCLTADGDAVYYGETLIGAFQPIAADAVEYSDKIEQFDANTLKITRTFTALSDIDSVRLTLDFRTACRSVSAMIPSVCYNGNHWGRGKEPKGFRTDGVWHTYSYRRTPIPGATYSESNDFAVAMWSLAPTDEADAFSCSLQPDTADVVHSLIFPEEERPFVYIDKNGYADGAARKLSMRKGETKVVEAYLFVAAKGGEVAPLVSFLDKAWLLADKEYARVIPAEKVWEYGVRYAKESLWAEEGDYKGFSIGLVPDGAGGWKQRPFIKYEIGWCGQNSSYINTLLTDYLTCGDESSRDKALTALDTWTAPVTQRENGFYIISYDNILSGREKVVSDACNLGTAAYNFFETIELLQKCNLSDRIERVKSVALGICDFVKNDQQPSGVYGKGWNSDGECLYRDGTVGAFMVAPMLRAYQVTGDSSYYHSARKAYDYYYSEFECSGYTTAGALDTWCIDKESSMPMLRASLMFYDATGDRKYIAHAERISYYLSTWLWHYKASYGADSDVTLHGYSTFGATSVSVQHHHLDVYALLWVGEWLRLAELSGNDVWRQKALAVWTNGCQLISDGSLEVNGLVRPVGGQNEAFFNCSWGHSWGNSDKSRMNNWLVAWPGAFRLETLRKLSDWKVLDSYTE